MDISLHVHPLPQILSTNSLLTLFPAYVRCRALSISPDVRRDSHCGERTSGYYCKETAWQEHEIDALSRQSLIFVSFSQPIGVDKQDK